MLTALLLQAAAPNLAGVDPAGFERAVWGRFERVVSRRRTVEEVAVAPGGWDAVQRRQHFRLRLVAREPDGRATTRWTDTRLCPAAREVVARFGSVPMPRPEPPTAVPRDIVVQADGTGYAVTLPVGYGGGYPAAPVTLRAGDRSPLAGWVIASFAALGPCWLEGPRL